MTPYTADHKNPEIPLTKADWLVGIKTMDKNQHDSTQTLEPQLVKENGKEKLVTKPVTSEKVPYLAQLIMTSIGKLLETNMQEILDGKINEEEIKQVAQKVTTVYTIAWTTMWKSFNMTKIRVLRENETVIGKEKEKKATTDTTNKTGNTTKEGSKTATTTTPAPIVPERKNIFNFFRN